MATVARFTVALGLVFLLVAFAGCGGGGVTSNSQPTAPTLTSIKVTGPASPPRIGSSAQFTATGSYSDGSSKDMTASVTWTSSDNNIVTIDATGKATAKAAGTANITAASGAMSDHASLTIPAAVLMSMAVSGPASLKIGLSAQFTATGSYDVGNPQDLTTQVTWASSNPAAVTIDARGMAKAIAAGSATITASFQGSNPVSGTASLSVPAAVLVSLVLSPDAATVAAGQSQPFAANGNYDDGSSKDLTSQVTWAAAPPSVATINATGVASTLTAGTATITAGLNGVQGQATLTVNPAALVSIAVAPGTPSISLGLTQQFAATGTYTDNSHKDLSATVTWTSADQSIAKVDATGLATAMGKGATTITATQNQISGTATLTVGDAVLRSLNVTASSTSVPLGLTQQFTATGTYSDNSTKDVTSGVTWASSDQTKATVDGAGLATTLAKGATNISASSNGIASNALQLNIIDAVLQTIAIGPTAPNVEAASTLQLTATGSYSDKTTGGLNSVTWTSSDETVATVDTTGLVSGVKAGTTTITAKSGSVTGTTTLTVGPRVLVSVTVSPAGSVTVPLKTTKQFTATANYDNGAVDITHDPGITWSTSDTTIATVDSNGLLTANKKATTTLKASFGGTDSAAVSVTVGDPIITSLQLVSRLDSGAVQAFPAEGIAVAPWQPVWIAVYGVYSDGSARDVTAEIQFSGRNSSALVGTNGIVIGLAAGTATATATYSGSDAPAAVTSSIPVTVAGSFDSMTLACTEPLVCPTPTIAALPQFGEVEFRAYGNFTSGGGLPVNNVRLRALDWTSCDGTSATCDPLLQPPTVATFIDHNLGWLQAVGTAGTTATIRAALGGLTADGTVNVGNATLSSLAVTPSGVFTMGRGTRIVLSAVGTYSDASQAPVNGLTCVSSDPSVINIDTSVRQQGVAPCVMSAWTVGNVTVTVSDSTSSAPPVVMNITIDDPSVDSLVVTPAAPTPMVGDCVQFTATANYSTGRTQDVSRAASWYSSDPSVALVDDLGQATFLKSGTVTITAQFAAGASVTVTVP